MLVGVSVLEHKSSQMKQSYSEEHIAPDTISQGLQDRGEILVPLKSVAKLPPTSGFHSGSFASLSK